MPDKLPKKLILEPFLKPHDPMRCRLKRILFILCSLLTLTSQSQDGVPVLYDYLTDNIYLLHPAQAGMGFSGKIRLTAGRQWVSEGDAPNLQTASAHARFGEKTGLGVIAFNDENGFSSQKGLQLTYAYHLNFGRDEIDLNMLSFGLNLGFFESELDETAFDPRIFDPIIAGTVQSDGFFNVDVGLSYHFWEFYSYFTVKNLLNRDRQIFTEGLESRNQRSYLMSLGYEFSNFRRRTYWEPSILFQFKEETEESSVDVNLKAYRLMPFGQVWAGVSVRRSLDSADFITNGGGVDNQNLNYFAGLVGVNYKDFMFGYTYIKQIGDIQFSNSAFHQITIGFEFMKRERPYVCHCASWH